MSESTDQTILEVADSLTGYDEQAITRNFGKPVSDLQFGDASMWVRSLLFIVKRRATPELNEDDARNTVMAMTIKDVGVFFEAEDADSGKDEQASEPQLESSPPSAS